MVTNMRCDCHGNRKINFLFRVSISFVQPTHRLIRLTSPKLNYIIGAGAVLLYLGIIIMVIPSTDPNIVKVLCNVSLHA